MKRICPCFHLESRSRKELEKQSLPWLVHFQLVFFSQTRDCMTFTLHDLTDFYVERVTAHRIKINDHVFTTAGQIKKQN